MSKNTLHRILSAIVMLIILGLAMWQGSTILSYLVLLIGLLVTHEIVANIFGRPLGGPLYLFSMLGYIAGAGAVYFLGLIDQVYQAYLISTVVLTLGYLKYLFSRKMNEDQFNRVKKWLSPFGGFFVAVPIVVLLKLIQGSDWRVMALILVLVTYGMDTGAWFFGKNFGKNKLWPRISPNKTIEGLVGGMFTSMALGSLAWYLIFNELQPALFVGFFFLGGISQLGDLFQSKLKRQAGIKDSSSLIPGHGGVYDRLDSLLFVVPFFVAMVTGI